ncbi:MAG: glycosyl hydrolase family 18 protein [Pseudomonadota bacterium]
MNRILMFIVVGAMACTNACGGAAQSAPQVMGWVPAYGLLESMAAMDSNPKVAEGLTRIGLQFWNPSDDGRNLVFAPINKQGDLITPSDVIQFRNWANARHITVFLTVYNNSQVTEKWDWALAKRAFDDKRVEFSAELIKEMNKYELDGIDLDLEGEGDHDQDRSAYALFVKELSSQLKAQGKLLTIDSFHSPCDNAPNMSWWGDWFGKVDAIHSMGYQDLYEGSSETFTPPGRPVCESGAHVFKYSWQLQYGMKAGYKPEQILMGMPTWLDSWGKGGLGSDLAAHLREAQTLGMGVALWDLQLAGEKWRSVATWNAILELRMTPGNSLKPSR